VLDLRSQDSIEHAVGEALAAFGQLDVLVNNAGVNLRQRAADVTPAEWDAVIDTNVTGTFFLTQQAGRHWIAGGRPGCVVNIASTHGLVGAAERSTYGISKAAIIHMTKMLAIEWAEHGIRVNAIAPGRVPPRVRIRPIWRPCWRAFRCIASRPPRKSRRPCAGSRARKRPRSPGIRW
jgi:NAD(P)-dependent dehydrogenase (short-subunit alcohol dehydrogenase family)